MKKIILIMLFAASGAAAESQYREDGTAVIVPPEAPVPVDTVTPIVKKFESAYKAADKPKIALFWNVELVDSVKDKHVKTERISGNITDKVNQMEKTTNGQDNSAKLIDGENRTNFNLTKTELTEQQSVNAKRKPGINERDAWKVETAFTGTMRKAGVRFIDRNSILRTTALKEDTNNLRELETKALLKKADLLMEVLMTKDAEAPLGWGYKVSVRDLKTGEEKTSIYSQAHPIVHGQSKTSYRATDKGFEKVTYSQQSTVGDIGEALAVDVMHEMSANLK